MALPAFTYSGVTYTAAPAGTTTFPLTTSGGLAIRYLQRSHIHAYTTTDNGATLVELARPAAWEFNAAGTGIVLTTGIAAGAALVLRRITPLEAPYVVFAKGSLLTSDELNEAVLASLYIDQEAQDRGDASYWQRNSGVIDRAAQVAGAWLSDDQHLATTAALAERFDTLLQDTAPLPPVAGEIRQPGKLWINDGAVSVAYWDPAAGAWIRLDMAGPPGPQGDKGDKGDTGPQGPPGAMQFMGLADPVAVPPSGPAAVFPGATYVISPGGKLNAAWGIAGNAAQTTPVEGQLIAWTGTAWVLIPNGVFVLPHATLTQRGIVQLASGAETTAGTDTAKATTPAGVRSALRDPTLTSLNGGQLAGMRNAIINGGFQVWQRGTSFTGGSLTQSYLADRWLTRCDSAQGNKTITREKFTLGQTEVPGEPLYFMRFDQSAVATGATYMTLEQRIGNAQTHAGQAATLSFWIRTADVGAVRTLPRISFTQWFGSGGTPSNYTDAQVASAVVVTHSWVRKSYTITLPSVAGKVLGTNDDDCLILQINLPVDAAFKIDIAQVQLESGTVASVFERRQRTYELALCTAFGRWVQFNQSLYAGAAGQALESPLQWATMRRTPTAGALTADPGLTPASTNVTSAAVERLTASGGSARVTATVAGLATHAGYRAWLDAELYLPGETGHS